jgi:hypothetical protein
VNDADRERAVRELSRHCGDGRLTLDELEDRIADVYAATTDAELALAFRELPPFGATRATSSDRLPPLPFLPTMRLGEPGLRPLIAAAWAAYSARRSTVT